MVACSGRRFAGIARHCAVPGKHDDSRPRQRIRQHDRGCDGFLSHIFQHSFFGVTGAAAALDPQRDSIQNAHTFHRIIADAGFAAQHDGIGLLEDRVGHIGNFRAGRQGIVDHRFQHVRRDDHRLSQPRAKLHNFSLNDRQLLDRAFDPEIAARHHDDVGRLR